MKANLKDWFILIVAVAIGLLLAYIDSSPGFDDSGMLAGMIFIITGLFGLISPKRAWLWALSVSVWIPLMGVFVTHNYGSFLALVIGFIGAYTGFFIRKAFNNG